MFFVNSHDDDGGGDDDREMESIIFRVPSGPWSPLRLKVDFVEEREELEHIAEAVVAAAAPAALAAGPSDKQAKGGWKSPSSLRSPFKGVLFGGGGSKKNEVGNGGVAMGTE